MSRKQSKHKHKKSGSADTLKGVLDITRSGMGFVIVENNPEDILVRPSDFNTALHGDVVRVKVRGDQSRTGRKQGEITEVVKRKQLEFMGRIDISQNFAFFIVNSDKPMPDIYVPLGKLSGAKNGDQVVVRIVEWEKNKKPVGEVIQVMDAADVNDQAMKEILIENGFSLMFPDSVIEESERIPDVLPAAEIKKRKDFREVLTFTIDPVDARDFDDAISFQVLKNGNYEIGVHIADVSYYVEPGTELDREAYDRATSVYLPDRVSPMLPERISNELCSLRPKEDKFTFAAVFEITPEGEIKSQWLGRTVIHSDHRYTYEEAQEIIEKHDGPFKDEILILNELAQNYRKRRFKRGAINFSSQEVRFKLDEKGKPIGIVVKESKEAHQLIEEFMLLANRAVAETVGKVKVEKEPVPFPYRVHDTPDEVKLTPFITFAKKYGHSFDTSSPDNIARSFNQMLDDVRGKPEQHVLEQLGIRTMAKAIYTTENIGHYGLGFEHYCHFTSPIRRYPDILVHRILQEILDRDIKPDKKLESKCKHCSDKERSAMEAERAANKYKQVEYMQDYLGEEFEGVISGVSSFGFWVETVQHKCEGLVSITSLSDYDDFRVVEGDYSLAGLRSGRKFRMGDKITIKIVAANLSKRQLDYEWVLAQGGAGQKTGETQRVASIEGAEGTGAEMNEEEMDHPGPVTKPTADTAGRFQDTYSDRAERSSRNRNSGNSGSDNRGSDKRGKDNRGSGKRSGDNRGGGNRKSDNRNRDNGNSGNRNGDNRASERPGGGRSEGENRNGGKSGSGNRNSDTRNGGKQGERNKGADRKADDAEVWVTAPNRAVKQAEQSPSVDEKGPEARLSETTKNTLGAKSPSQPGGNSRGKSDDNKSRSNKTGGRKSAGSSDTKSRKAAGKNGKSKNENEDSTGPKSPKPKTRGTTPKSKKPKM